MQLTREEQGMLAGELVPVTNVHMMGDIRKGSFLVELKALTITEGWEPDALEHVRTGDWVRVDPEARTLLVLRRSKLG